MQEIYERFVMPNNVGWQTILSCNWVKSDTQFEAPVILDTQSSGFGNHCPGTNSTQGMRESCQ